MNTKQTAANVEQVVRVQNGWVMLVVVVGLLLGDAAVLIFSIQDGTQASGQPQAKNYVPTQSESALRRLRDCRQ